MLWMVVCETLLPGVLAPAIHQNDCSYAHEFGQPTFDEKFSMVDRHTENLKNNRIVKIGQWVFAQGWAIS